MRLYIREQGSNRILSVEQVASWDVIPRLADSWVHQFKLSAEKSKFLVPGTMYSFEIYGELNGTMKLLPTGNPLVIEAMYV